MTRAAGRARLGAIILVLIVGLGLGPMASAAAGTLQVAGTELYGYLPYWEMNATVADYLAREPLTDLELFSVSAATNGGLHRSETGYRRITGAIGTRLIGEAHARGQRVQLVFTSFTYEKNTPFFGRPGLNWLDDRRGVQRAALLPTTAPPPWRRTARELVDLAVTLGVDGIDVDVELVRADSHEGYADFLLDLRSRLDAAIPGARLTVATMANRAGAALARAAITGGVDRVFLMGYEYHWSGSDPGASAPILRVDGSDLSLTNSIAAYANAGVPPAKTILGLPLFGMSWTVATPSPFAPRLERGVHWFPSNHVAQLTAPGFSPWFDWLETVEYVMTPIASVPPTWQAIFYDSPRTLRPKLALAVSNGFAGAGFWAIGYERGLPGYIELMADFRAGRVTTVPAPVSPQDR